MYSVNSISIFHRIDYSIRKSSDQSLLAAPRSLSQLVASFIGTFDQGIHRMPYLLSIFWLNLVSRYMVSSHLVLASREQLMTSHEYLAFILFSSQFSIHSSQYYYCELTMNELTVNYFHRIHISRCNPSTPFGRSGRVWKLEIVNYIDYLLTISNLQAVCTQFVEVWT